MRLTPRLATVLGAAFALSLAVAAPAFANTTFTLKQSNVTAAGFGDHSCDLISASGPVAGKDGWLFVLPDQERAFVTLTLTFSGGTGGGSGGSTLPVTGTAVGGSLLVALLLIGAGAALVVVRRRRIKFEA